MRKGLTARSHGQKHGDALFAPDTEPDAADLAQVGLYVASKALVDRARMGPGPWTNARLAGWRNGPTPGGAMVIELEQSSGVLAEGAVAPAAPVVVKVKPVAPGFGAHELGFDVEVTNPEAETASFTGLYPAHGADGALATVLNGGRQQLRITAEPGSREAGEKLHLFSRSKALDAAVSRKLPAWLAAGAVVRKAGSARAPMPSRIVQVMVTVGQVVRQGDPLVMVEAMKTVSQHL